jgi:NAD(P)H-quinone oxidoreductase subunit 5
VTAPLAFTALIPAALFGAVAVAAARRRDGRGPGVARLGSLASAAGVVVALAVAAVTALHGTSTSPTLGTADLGLSVRLDALSVTMLAMIAVLAAVVVRYSRTYLDGDPRRDAFLGRLAATIAAVEVMVVSGNLVLLVAAWVTTSLTLHGLLVFHGDRPRAVVAARKKFVLARIGDVLLVGAAVALYDATGTGDLGTILDQASQLPPAWAIGGISLAAVLLAAAAALKSAQFPTHGWLVEVMETPTPVSALLHAGILNAGPFLAIRTAYVLDSSRTATTALLVVGGTTAVVASIVLLTQPSVKVALAYSSAAHMGFMLMICGMGLYPAALLHLVAHSFYKAHAFLSSGSVIDDQRASGVALPRRLGRPGRVLASTGIALALYLPLALLLGVDLVGEPVLLAVGAILVLGTTQLVAPALDSTGTAAGVVRAVVLAAGVTVSFFTLEAGAHHLLQGAVPELVPRDGIQLALVVAVLLAFATVVALQIIEPARPSGPRRRALAVHLRNGLYANAVYDRVIGALRVRPQAAPLTAPGAGRPGAGRPGAGTAPTDQPLEASWN